MQRRRPRSIAVTALVLMLAQTSCMTAPRAVSSPSTYLAQHSPSRAWITLADGSSHEIEHPRVFGDSLLGDIVTETGEGDELWVANANIRELRVRNVSMLRTGGLILGVAAGVALIAAMISSSGEGDPNICRPTNPEDCN